MFNRSDAGKPCNPPPNRVPFRLTGTRVPVEPHSRTLPVDPPSWTTMSTSVDRIMVEFANWAVQYIGPVFASLKATILRLVGLP